MNFEKNKLVVVGSGMVGSAVLNTALSLGLLSEVVVIDKNMDRARGEALDSSHTTSFAYSPNVQVRAGTYEDCADAQIVVVTAGPSVRPGDLQKERTSLAEINTQVVAEVMESIRRYTQEAIIILVTNPLDVVVYQAQNRFGYPADRIMGTGTMLDTARFRRILAKRYDVDTKNVHGYVLGEHGTSAFIGWSLVNIAGIPLSGLDAAFGAKDPLDREETLHEVIKAGYDIVRLKGYTSAGIAMSVCRIIKAIILNEESVLPVSTTLHGEYGVDNVAISIPCVVTNRGISRRLVLPLAADEVAKLQGSAGKLASLLDELHLRDKN